MTSNSENADLARASYAAVVVRCPKGFAGEDAVSLNLHDILLLAVKNQIFYFKRETSNVSKNTPLPVAAFAVGDSVRVKLPHWKKSHGGVIEGINEDGTFRMAMKNSSFAKCNELM